MTTAMAKDIIKDIPLSERMNTAAASNAPFRNRSAVVHVLDTCEDAPAPAWYEVRTGDVYIDLSQLPVDLTVSVRRAVLDLDESSVEYHIINGVMLHELAHSRWSNWIDKPIPKDVANTLLVFEEGRIERNVVNICGERAMTSLRLAFSKVLLGGFKDIGSNPYVVAGNYALVAGRVHAGHIGYDEVIDIENAVRTILGDDIVDELDEILGQALLCRTDNDYGLNSYISLAKEWNDVLADAFGDASVPTEMLPQEQSESVSTPAVGTEDMPTESDEDSDDEDDGDATAVDGEGSGEIDSEDGDDPDYGLGAKDSVDKALTTGNTDDRWLEDMDASKVLADAIERLRDATSTPMPIDKGKRSLPGEFAHVFSAKRNYPKSSWKMREPDKNERRAATLLTKLFEEMSTPAIVKRKASAPLPPGRLRGRDAVRMSADRAAGRMSAARPWQVEKRKHDTAPPITIGIATDTSGSMKWAEEMVASTAWIFAMAGHRIGANVAAVTFGNEAEAVVRPREMPAKVMIRKANGSIEAFDDAMASLDSALHLTDGRPGRKVLVIVSDGHFVRRHESAKRRAWMRALVDSNVDVIWMNVAAQKWDLDTMIERDCIEGVRAVGIQPGNYEEMVRTVVTALGK